MSVSDNAQAALMSLPKQLCHRCLYPATDTYISHHKEIVPFMSCLIQELPPSHHSLLLPLFRHVKEFADEVRSLPPGLRIIES